MTEAATGSDSEPEGGSQNLFGPPPDPESPDWHPDLTEPDTSS